jgi:Uma2 family endonuclease
MASALGRVKQSKRTTKGRGGPAWDVALCFPMQGDWSEADYLALDRDSEPRLIELNDGVLEVLPMPDMYHQDIVQFLFMALTTFLKDLRIGRAYVAPMPVKLWNKQFRKPDVIFLASHRIEDKHKPPKGADLVMEVVSRGAENRKRDLQEKRRVYARAKIAEYWIIDPEKLTITVFTLSGKRYRAHGVCGLGDQAASKLLKDFTVSVTDVFAAGEGK